MRQTHGIHAALTVFIMYFVLPTLPELYSNIFISQRMGAVDEYVSAELASMHRNWVRFSCVTSDCPPAIISIVSWPPRQCLLLIFSL